MTRTGAEPVGRPQLPGLLHRLSAEPDDPVDGWRAPDQVLSGFDAADGLDV